MPIEISQELSEAEKLPHMVAWWNSTHELITKMQLSRQDVRDMVKEHPIRFRGGVHQMVELCEQHRLPVLVFSAGVADVIQFLVDIIENPLNL